MTRPPSDCAAQHRNTDTQASARTRTRRGGGGSRRVRRWTRHQGPRVPNTLPARSSWWWHAPAACAARAAAAAGSSAIACDEVPAHCHPHPSRGLARNRNMRAATATGPGHHLPLQHGWVWRGVAHAHAHTWNMVMRVFGGSRGKKMLTCMPGRKTRPETRRTGQLTHQHHTDLHGPLGHWGHARTRDTQCMSRVRAWVTYTRMKTIRGAVLVALWPVRMVEPIRSPLPDERHGGWCTARIAVRDCHPPTSQPPAAHRHQHQPRAVGRLAVPSSLHRSCPDDLLGAREPRPPHPHPHPVPPPPSTPVRPPTCPLDRPPSAHPSPHPPTHTPTCWAETETRPAGTPLKDDAPGTGPSGTAPDRPAAPIPAPAAPAAGPQPPAAACCCCREACFDDRVCWRRG